MTTRDDRVPDRGTQRGLFRMAGSDGEKPVCPHCNGAGGSEHAFSSSSYDWVECPHCKGSKAEGDAGRGGSLADNELKDLIAATSMDLLSSALQLAGGSTSPEQFVANAKTVISYAIHDGAKIIRPVGESSQAEAIGYQLCPAHYGQTVNLRVSCAPPVRVVCPVCHPPESPQAPKGTEP